MLLLLRNSLRCGAYGTFSALADDDSLLIRADAYPRTL